MEEEIFEYNEVEHKGTINGKVIPSTTQLLEVLFPMSGIKKEVLANASEYGTTVHNDLHDYFTYKTFECHTQEGRNFVRLMKDLELEYVDSEKQIIIREPFTRVALAFGTYDLLVRTTKNICVENGKIVLKDEVQLEDELDEEENVIKPKDNVLYLKDRLILIDFKTVNQFVNEKVSMQTSIYAFGYNNELIGQKGKPISYVCGVWLRDDICQLRPLEKIESGQTFNLIRALRGMWYEQREQIAK